MSGNTSVTFGDLRAHGGRIELRKCIRSPVAGVDPAVVHPGRGYLDRTRPGYEGSLLRVAITNHETTTVGVNLTGEARDVGIDFGF
jgi:hypothetical protein